MGGLSRKHQKVIRVPSSATGSPAFKTLAVGKVISDRRRRQYTYIIDDYIACALFALSDCFFFLFFSSSSFLESLRKKYYIIIFLTNANFISFIY